MTRRDDERRGRSDGRRRGRSSQSNPDPNRFRQDPTETPDVYFDDVYCDDIYCDDGHEHDGDGS